MMPSTYRASEQNRFPWASECNGFSRWSIGNLHREAKRQRAFTDIQSRA